MEIKKVEKYELIDYYKNKRYYDTEDEVILTGIFGIVLHPEDKGKGYLDCVRHHLVNTLSSCTDARNPFIRYIMLNSCMIGINTERKEFLTDRGLETLCCINKYIMHKYGSTKEIDIENTNLIRRYITYHTLIGPNTFYIGRWNGKEVIYLITDYGNKEYLVDQCYNTIKRKTDELILTEQERMKIVNDLKNTM